MKTLLRGLTITLATFLATVALLIFAVSQLNAGSEREQAAAVDASLSCDGNWRDRTVLVLSFCLPETG